MVVAVEIMINMAAPANEEVPVEMTNSSHHIIHTTNQRIEGNHLIGEVQIEVEGEEVETIPLMDEEDSKVSTVIDHGLLQILAKRWRRTTRSTTSQTTPTKRKGERRGAGRRRTLQRLSASSILRKSAVQDRTVVSSTPIPRRNRYHQLSPYLSKSSQPHRRIQLLKKRAVSQSHRSLTTTWTRSPPKIWSKKPKAQTR